MLFISAEIIINVLSRIFEKQRSQISEKGNLVSPQSPLGPLFFRSRIPGKNIPHGGCRWAQTASWRSSPLSGGHTRVGMQLRSVSNPDS